MSAQKQERLLFRKPEIVVATPGRFWELLQEVKYYVENNGFVFFSHLNS